MTPIDAVLIVAATAALSWGWFYAGRRSMVKRLREAVTMFPPQVVKADPTAELLAAERVITVLRERVELLQSMRLVPPSEYTVLPYQVVPSRREVAFSEGLAEEVMVLRRQLADRDLDVQYFADLAAKRWKWLKAARAKIRELTPKVTEELPLLYEDFEREVGLKDGYHRLASSFAGRITTAREAIASAAMREEIDSILGGTLLQFPSRDTREKVAA